MRPRRLVELSLAAALARVEALGPVLARVSPAQREAAALLNAGRLEEGLAAAQMDPDLVRLARAWPAAVLPAVQRISGLPHRLELLAAPLQTLAMLVPLALVQHVFTVEIAPLLLLKGVFNPELFDSVSPISGAPPLGEFMFVLVIPAMVLLACLTICMAILSERTMGQVERRSARSALLAQSLAESGAPAELRRLLDPELGTMSAVELAAQVTRELGFAWAAQARQVTLLRQVGFGALAFSAALQLYTYHSIMARFHHEIPQ